MKKSAPELNHRIGQLRADGYNALRVWAIPASKRKGPRLRIKCGCCDQQLVIYHDSDNEDLEINGVFGSVENWREILLPLLEPAPAAPKPAAKKAPARKRPSQA